MMNKANAKAGQAGDVLGDRNRKLTSGFLRDMYDTYSFYVGEYWPADKLLYQSQVYSDNSFKKNLWSHFPIAASV